MIAAALLADHSPINDAVDAISNGTIYSEEEIQAILMDYSRKNFLVFSLTLGPSLIYLAYRTGRGMVTARHNSHIKNIKSWF